MALTDVRFWAVGQGDQRLFRGIPVRGDWVWRNGGFKQSSLAITASIGVTLFPTDDGEPDALLHHADLAMYQAKLSGKAQYRFYEDTFSLNRMADSALPR